MLQTTHDVIIVGGGMVGLALALALAQHTRLSIAVLEAKPQPHDWSPATYFHRVSALALSSQRILNNLGVWSAIQQKRVSPFTEIHVWDAAQQGRIHFASAEIAETQLGFIVENNVIQAALLEKLRAQANIEFIAPIAPTAFAVNDNQVELTCADGRLLTAKLAVAADGANSWLRRAADIEIDKLDYEQEAIVTTVTTKLAHAKVARQVFLPTGPLAFLPLAETNKTSIVWSLPVAEAKRLLTVEMEKFQLELTQASGQCLGEVLEVEPRHAFPLSKHAAKQYVKPRVALIGDAAHTVHPLAGQGVNMGLLDAASLAEIVINACQRNRDFANKTHLRRYERWRKAENFAMLTGVDIIKNLFASDKKSLQHLRSFGLNTTNQLPLIKNLFTRHAVGTRAGLPWLAADIRRSA